jgi:motility quorum-sensing regulator/GCU-specific mRNA interferase toxin
VVRDAWAFGYSLEDVVDVVQVLEPGDFVKSETAHSPPNTKVRHDTYNIPSHGLYMYLTFAGETLIGGSDQHFQEPGQTERFLTTSGAREEPGNKIDALVDPRCDCANRKRSTAMSL